MIIVGGNALNNGIKLQTDSFIAKAVRKRDGAIQVEMKTIKSSWIHKKLNKVPFIRGILFAWIAIPLLSIGLSALKRNPNVFFFLAIIICGLASTLVFMQYKKYSWLGYHGAEHKVIRAYQNNEVLDISTVDKESRLHLSCGSMYVLNLTIFMGIIYFITQGEPFLTTVLALSFAYEMHRIKKPLNIPMINIFFKFGLFCQRAVTTEPTDDQIEVSIRCINELILNEENIGACEQMAP